MLNQSADFAPASSSWGGAPTSDTSYRTFGRQSLLDGGGQMGRLDRNYTR